jgi:hypothetical protein
LNRIEMPQTIQNMASMLRLIADKTNPLKEDLNQFGVTEGARAHGGGSGVRAYKGMHPYDAAGNPITKIERNEPLPAYNHGEPGVKVGGFYSSDPAVASRFARGLSEHGGAVYPVNIGFKNPYVIDAAGKPAGRVQFGPEGKEFRDAVRSGKYDGVVIKNTADEGNVHVALGRGTVKSAITGETLFGMAAALLGLGDRQEPQPPF